MQPRCHVAGVGFPLLLLLTFLIAAPAHGEIKVANIFNDRMVLPREMPVPVWGKAEAGEAVTVEFAGQKKTANANREGAWSVTLDPLAASAESRSLTVSGAKTPAPVIFKEILVGEVWLGSGQSNMAMSAGPEGAEADTPTVRFTFVESFYPGARAPDLKSRCKWRDASAKTAPSCSGVGLWFARRLQAELGVPVGIIVSAAGGTRAEAWTRQDVIAKVSGPGSYREKMLREVEKVKASPPPANTQPASSIIGTEDWMHARLGGRFNGMIAPLAPFAVRGVIWYQGEDNAREHAAYANLLPAMIADWRSTWGRELPFFIVQLPAYNAERKPDGTDWAAMREVQERIAKTMPSCGLAVTLDNTDPDQLHPKNKRAVGTRLGLLALRQIYKRDVVASGPLFVSMKIADGTALIRFRELGGSLVSKTGDSLTGFTVAGANHRFVRADARIEADTVFVSAAGVKEPAAVRYAWVNAPETSLVSKAGLPAAPFRTDDWK